MWVGIETTPSALSSHGAMGLVLQIFPRWTDFMLFLWFLKQDWNQNHSIWIFLSMATHHSKGFFQTQTQNQNHATDSHNALSIPMKATLLKGFLQKKNVTEDSSNPQNDGWNQNHTTGSHNAPSLPMKTTLQKCFLQAQNAAKTKYLFGTLKQHRELYAGFQSFTYPCLSLHP